MLHAWISFSALAWICSIALYVAARRNMLRAEEALEKARILGKKTATNLERSRSLLDEFGPLLEPGPIEPQDTKCLN